MTTEAYPDDKRRAEDEAKRLLKQGLPAVSSFFVDDDNEADTESYEELIELLKPLWVDPRSSQALGRAGSPEARLDGFTLVVDEPRLFDFAGRCYVDQAFFRSKSKLRLKVVTVHADQALSSGQAQARAIVDEVRRELIGLYRKALRGDQSDRNIERVLNLARNDQPPRPTFVLLPQHLVGDATVAEAIRAVFPSVALLQTTAVAPQPANEAAPLLDPSPQPGVIAEHKDLYDSAFSHL